MPQAAPELAGATIIVSGSGCRLRDITEEHIANLACILVEKRGLSGRMFTSPNLPFGWSPPMSKLFGSRNI